MNRVLLHFKPGFKFEAYIVEDQMKIFTLKPRLSAGVFDINLSQEQKHYIIIVERAYENCITEQFTCCLCWTGLSQGGDINAKISGFNY